MEAPLKIYALLTSVSRIQLLTSWVENGLLAYVKVSNSYSSNLSRVFQKELYNFESL